MNSGCCLLRLCSLSFGTRTLNFCTLLSVHLVCIGVTLPTGSGVDPSLASWTSHHSVHNDAPTLRQWEPKPGPSWSHWQWEGLSTWGGYIGKMWACSCLGPPMQIAHLETKQTEPGCGESEIDVIVWAIESSWAWSHFSRWNNTFPFLFKLMWVWFYLV